MPINAAAEVIADKAVPRVSRVIPEQFAGPRDFRRVEGGGTGEQLPASKPAKVTKTFHVDRDETYQLVVEIEGRPLLEHPAQVDPVLVAVERHLEEGDVFGREERQQLPLGPERVPAEPLTDLFVGGIEREEDIDGDP